ncbi:MAG: MarR family transcriptional regulator [Phycisphaerae bacterium]|nr:MarR family transcriptional regulator [Phycisphaerae bacterium]
MPETAQLAEAILAMSKKSWIEASSETAEITESEFLALDYLAEVGTATVGEAQKHMRVVPAQMSRLLRRLQAAKLVTSGINREDRRRVDMTISESGRAVHAKYRTAKLAPIVAALDRLSRDEREAFMKLVNKMTER